MIQEEGQMHRSHVWLAVLAALLLVPASATAGNYPPPSDPGSGTGKSHGKGQTLTVCKRGCDYKNIQKAIDAASGKDTIRVKKGTYRESVQIVGSRYDGLKLIGDPKHRDRVVLDGKSLKSGDAQNAVLLNNADDVTVRGFHAVHYKANCFFATNLQDYVLDQLEAERCGVYGVYAFNSKGGVMSNSEAYYNPDSGFYVGQTPPQKGRKKRTLVKNVSSWGNVLGFSGTNMRYTTITKSRWFNNGAGIVPNVLDSEKYYPPTGNVLSDNDVFWNNFNFYFGAPFKIPQQSAASIPYPIGIGILLFGSQNTVVENNRIFGNYLGGFAEVPAVQLSGNADPKKNEASILRNNTVRGNDFGGGNDLNGRDMLYDGSGSGNCFEGNTTRSPNLPANNGTFVACPGPNPNVTDPAVLPLALTIGLGDPKDPASFEKNWIKHPHPARKGVKPLEHYGG
ncbi:MAG: hypothetical protein QOK00_1330 [Thermoleophilaceae bacterium]|jgi:hypothetical protein|nr:hypothetical protein [Thermoleophilaceae bacterium]